MINIFQENKLFLAVQSQVSDVNISGKPITNSKLIEAGDIFVCIKGFTSDGHNYISQAREKGAILIIQETDFVDNKPAIRITDSRKAAALIAKLYYNNPTSKFTLIGVTGTNGKTTSSLLIWQALNNMGLKTGWIGTLGYRIESEIIPTNNTTPDIMELNQIFDIFVKAECKYVVMEVSSHALALDRVYGVEFDYAIFTNLTRDHLDFHNDMQDYFNSKSILFKYTLYNKGKCIINIDDEYGKRLVNNLSVEHSDRLITISDSLGDVTIGNYESHKQYSTFNLDFVNDIKLNIKSNLNGRFNAFNLSMALVVLKEIYPKLSQTEIDRLMEQITPVRGRLERIENDLGISVFVDYAHTPDALENVIKACKELPHKRILVLFGAGGDRDQGKRPAMLKVALTHADATIITDDNPRSEDPNAIIKDIISETDIWKPWWIIRNRDKAIQSILRLATKDDIVIIAGKGHETYQEIYGVKHYFDDSETARKYLNMKQVIREDELVLPIDPLMLTALYDTDLNNETHTNSYQCPYYERVSTDSRKIKPNSVFFALRGENFDGHHYLSAVLKDNTNCAVISDENYKNNNTILYNDTQLAYGLLAKKYLIMFGIHKIALTGSTGKTTTKEFMASIFSVKGNVLKTLENENNILGLSKTIFHIKPDDDTAVFELGTNHFGEIKVMADICNPDIALITNIGASHLEFLIDEAGVYKEKTDLFRGNAKTIIFPGDDKRFSEFVNIGKSVGYSDSCDYQIRNVEPQESGYEFELNNSKYFLNKSIPLYISNLAFAIACAKESGLTDEEIKLGLDKSVELNLRMDIKNYADDTYIFDCYNANPVSMKSAIEFWNSYQPDKLHIAILGDMLELGDKSIDFHKQVGEQLSQLNFDKLITIGELSKCYVSDCISNPLCPPKQHNHYQTIDELLIKPFLPLSVGHVTVLVKASHGMHLEKLLDAIESYYRSQTQEYQVKQRGE
jgi:UDP-N-acetylmuramyl-tripeptide synthetase/UDP-N-acetylmuramoyl-tripeptide--D-alanyl-D-alanine ligase